MFLKQSILFTKEECDKMISFKNIYPLGGDNGRYDDIERFDYKFYTIDKKQDTQWVLEKLLMFFNNETNLKVPLFLNKSLNMHHYTVGNQFGKHIDTGDPIKEWNLGIQLNEDYEGGDYNLYDEDGNKVSIDKKIGNVSLYQSQTPHEVTPIISGERWSIAVFIPKESVVEKKINTIL
jgi:predicted 2-oxoglutarate/Fe(II)-dependent dioxygenase YbiX